MTAKKAKAKQRYFYRCPLKAAFMAKYHGVKFTDGDSLRSACEVVGKDGKDLMNSGAFYISNTSILKPRPEDLVFLTGYGDELDSALPYGFIMECERIVERNGIPFLWPEEGTI